MILYAATSNTGKMREILRACKQAGADDLTIEPLPGLAAIVAPEEHGNTFEENAIAKAVYYSGFTENYVLADDSGLETEALHNEPGVHSARYAGNQATDSANNELVLRNMHGVSNRAGRFVAVIALARTGEVCFTARGVVEGQILEEPKGTNGFGYDPLFFYPPFDRSFGEIGPDEKLSVSHRGNALRAVFRWIVEHRNADELLCE